MKVSINVNVEKLTEKDANRTRSSMRSDRYVAPDNLYTGKLHKICYINLPNNRVVTFNPELDCAITIGKTKLIMPLKEIESLKVHKKGNKE